MGKGKGGGSPPGHDPKGAAVNPLPDPKGAPANPLPHPKGAPANPLPQAQQRRPAMPSPPRVAPRTRASPKGR